MTIYSSTDTPDWPVVVVGAGLAGSAAAAFLSHAGVPTVVLERHEQPTARPRAWVVSARSQELLRPLGLAEAVRTLGSPGSWHVQTVDSLKNAPTGRSVPDDSAGVSPTGAASCDQDIVEDLLQGYAARHGVGVQRGETVTGLTDRDGAVEVHRAGAGSLTARWVILADGARAGLLPGVGVTSTRPRTDTPDGALPEFDQVLFRSRELDELMADRAGKAFLFPQAGIIVFRRDLGRWQLQRQGGRFTDVEADIATVVGQPVDVEILDHSPWQPAARLADTFRTGNVFLAGDTAHAMPPSLGMGGNLAIADAHNLAWKLAWVYHRRAGSGLLDSYDAERRPVGRFVVEQSLRHTGEGTDTDLLAVQLGLSYPAGSSAALAGAGSDELVTDPRRTHPRVGARLPHQWLPDGRSTLDLVAQDTFVAVGAIAPDATPVPFHHLPTPPANAGDERVWLVRPDGHVAAHVEPADIAATLDTLLDRCTGKAA